MNTELDELLLRMKLDGWCVLKEVIPYDVVGKIRDSVADTVASSAQKAPQGIGFLAGLINHNQSFAPYLVDSRLMGISQALLGDHFRVSFTSAIINYTKNPRGGWHADWPFNQNAAGHVAAPYPDAVMHLTTLWMLSPFDERTGGTLIVSGSHRYSNNPTGEMGFDAKAPYPSERQAVGQAGDVLVLDSRLWHATAENTTNDPRVAVAVRIAPWWLNLNILRPGSADRRKMVDEPGLDENMVPLMPQEAFERLPDNVKPLFAHSVEL